MKTLCELLKILLKLVVFILIVLEALIISLVSLVPVLEGRRSRRVPHLSIFFVDVRQGRIEGLAANRAVIGTATAPQTTFAALTTLTVPLPAVLRIGLLESLALLIDQALRRAFAR